MTEQAIVDKPYCDIDIVVDIKKYIQTGWHSYKRLFTNRVAKENISDQVLTKQVKNALLLLAAVRRYVIDDTFLCTTNGLDETHIYKSYGSTDITSDYDLTILGRYAPEIVYHIFKRFYNKYHNTVSNAFDTNLYCNGYYLDPVVLPPTIKKQSIRFTDADGIKTITFRPVTTDDQTVCLTYACIKLLQYLPWPELMEGHSLEYYFEQAIGEYETLKLKYENIDIDHAVETDNTYLLRKYELMIDCSKKLFDNLYSGKFKSSKTLFSLMCEACFHAHESYYTPCTINIVVLEMQAQRSDLNLQPIDYICGVIENLGDLIAYYVKAVQSGVDSFIAFCKVLKYIYRIEFMFDRLKVESHRSLVENYKQECTTETIASILPKYKEFKPVDGYDYLKSYATHVLDRIE